MDVCSGKVRGETLLSRIVAVEDFSFRVANLFQVYRSMATWNTEVMLLLWGVFS